ncbi:GNAT family N-acetyltransferase [Pedobacter sp. SD-b]|uniref:GNAT family N-acetyltransferase n=1 Tax=Pedobacter segetis TaxID=2793069 RepID=A0ABS1BME9_9SPHI|nr:GNAT family N-acetyltransferase [Pedobacter segetis]MBK0383978.1 GNAT family N-acetyltransferase [Pedobacter segetis]
METIINDEVYLKKGYFINTDKSLLKLDYIYQYLSEESYWAKGLSREKFETSIKGSTCFGVFLQEKQIGFARVISDKSTFAYLADVFIDKHFRKQGLSKWLVQTIINHKDFEGIRRFLLATADAHQLYKKFGFEPLNQPDRFMQKFKPYQTSSS